VTQYREGVPAAQVASAEALDLHARRSIVGQVPEVHMKLRVLSACVAAVITLGVVTPVSLGASSNTTHRLESGADDARDLAKAQVEFGIRVAQKKLWREAIFRFEKAVEVDPTYPEAWNNLAIAYEEQGKFADADRAYTKALQLDPDNLLIQQNYDQFKEIYVRLKVRGRR
jgi:tetratricopeptide (TPR) repeat protein